MATKYTAEFKREAIRHSTLGYLSPAEWIEQPAHQEKHQI